MKKEYIAPQIDTVLLNAIDVVTISDDGYDNYLSDPFEPLN